MATQGKYTTETFEAGSDLSGNQSNFVTLASDGQIDATGAGARATGVLLNKPTAAGAPATVAVVGRVKVEVGSAGITRGGEVAADTNGAAVDAGTGDIVLGYAVETGVDGQICTIDLIQGGNAA